VGRLIQVYNSRIRRWVKIDRETGSIVGVKKTPKPYKNIPKYRKKR